MTSSSAGFFRILLTLMLAFILVVALAPAALGSVSNAQPARGNDSVSGKPSRLPAAGQMRRDLGQILSAPEFANASGRVAPSQTGAARFWRRLIDWFRDFMRNLAGPVAAHPQLATFIMALLMLVLIYFAARIAMGSFAQIALRRGSASASAAHFGPIDFAALSSEAAAKGDYPAAVRFAFLAFIRGLDIEYSSNLTNRAILRSLRSTRPQLAGPAAAVIRIFEDSWYGKFPVGPGEYAACSALLEQTRGGRDEVG